MRCRLLARLQPFSSCSSTTVGRSSTRRWPNPWSPLLSGRRLSNTITESLLAREIQEGGSTPSPARSDAAARDALRRRLYSPVEMLHPKFFCCSCCHDVDAFQIQFRGLLRFFCSLSGEQFPMTHTMDRCLTSTSPARYRRPKPPQPDAAIKSYEKLSSRFMKIAIEPGDEKLLMILLWRLGTRLTSKSLSLMPHRGWICYQCLLG